MQSYIFHPLLREISNDISRFVFSSLAIVRPEVQTTLIKLYDGEIIVNDHSLDMTMSDIIEDFNKLVKREVAIEKFNANISPLMNREAQIITLFLYETLKGSQYKDGLKNEKIFKFLGHLRNAAGHNNKFHFKYPDGRSSNFTAVEWEGKKIEKSMEGEKVFGDFISLFDLYKLTHDLSTILFRLDKSCPRG